MTEQRRRRGRKAATGRTTSGARATDSSDRAGGAPGFTLWTAVFGGMGLATAALGFLLLSQGSIALAPTLLVVAFLVFFPLALTR